MLTAKSSCGRGEGLVLGADGYITKPYGRNTLDYALRYVLKQAVPQEWPQQKARPGAG